MTSQVANSGQQQTFPFGVFEILPTEIREQILAKDANIYKTMRQTSKAFKQGLGVKSLPSNVQETMRVYQNITKACYVKQSCASHNMTGLYFRGSAIDSSVIYAFDPDIARGLAISALQTQNNGQITQGLSEGTQDNIEGEVVRVQGTHGRLHLRSFSKDFAGKIEWKDSVDVFQPDANGSLIHLFSTKGITDANRVAYNTAPEIRGFAALQGVDAVLANGEVYLFSAENDHASFKHYVSLSAQERTNCLAQQKKLQLSTVGIKALGVSADGKKLYVRGVEEFAVYDFGSGQAKTHKFASILTRIRTLTFYLQTMYKEMATSVTQSIKQILKASGITSGVAGGVVTAIMIAILLLEPVVTLPLILGTALTIVVVAAATFVINVALSSLAMSFTGLAEGRRYAVHQLAP